MTSNQRRQQILFLLSQKKEVHFRELKERFQVSVATIRRDLTKLEGEGQIRRTHGGAVLETRSQVDFSYMLREKDALKQKIRIAEKTIEFINPGDRIFFNDGTTVMQIAKHLAKLDFAITAITNGIKVAEILLNNPKIDIIIVGGNIEELSFACVGPLAEQMIESLHCTKAIISCDGFHPQKGVTAELLSAAVTRRMVVNSEKVILVADSGKKGTVSETLICKWKDVDIFITDFIDTKSYNTIAKKSVLIPLLKL